MARRPQGGQDIHGWLPIYKESGMTSTRVVERVRRILGAAKAGHGGTLDPFAEGLLPVAMGDATKTLSMVLEGGKSYHCWVRFGLETDTDDLTGEPLWETGRVPTGDQVAALLPEFTGTIQQVPPVYSAVRVDGNRAYHMARRGVPLDLPARTVHIYHLALLSYAEGVAELAVESGKGTYMRALARDLGRRLDCGGHLMKLIRTHTLGFTLEQAIRLDELQQAVQEGRGHALVLPVDRVLDGIPALRLGHEAWYQAKNGQAVWVVAPDLRHGTVRLLTPDGVCGAIGELQADLDEQGRRLCEPRRVFHVRQTR